MAKLCLDYFLTYFWHFSATISCYLLARIYNLTSTCFISSDYDNGRTNHGPTWDSRTAEQCIFLHAQWGYKECPWMWLRHTQCAGLVVSPKVMECLVMDHWHFRLLSPNLSLLKLHVLLIWAFVTTNAYRARRTFSGTKAVGNSPTDRPAQMPKGGEEKIYMWNEQGGQEGAILSTSNLNLAFEGLCIAT